MEVRNSSLEGVLVIEPKRFSDDRGYLLETWQAERYQKAGISIPFVQDNLSFSRHGVVRGLHIQNPNGQAKLVQVLQGEVFDVAVDMRIGSPTFGQWTSVVLSAENGLQLFIPKGFAHGSCVTSQNALFAYKCSDQYAPQNEITIRWDDPDIAIGWPGVEHIISSKDAAGVFLTELDKAQLPQFES